MKVDAGVSPIVMGIIVGVTVVVVVVVGVIVGLVLFAGRFRHHSIGKFIKSTKSTNVASKRNRVYAQSRFGAPEPNPLRNPRTLTLTLTLAPHGSIGRLRSTVG